MSDVKELVADLRESAICARIETDRQELTEAADQIERDQKRIAELDAANMELHHKLAVAELNASTGWGRYENVNKARILCEQQLSADSRALAAAEAMKEAAAKVADENFHRGGYFIRALSASEIVKGITQ